MKSSRIQTAAQTLLIVLFCALITFPLIGTFFHWDFYPRQKENRYPAAFPDCKALSVAKLPAAFDAYLNDHFGFRNTLIRRYTRLSKDLFNVRKKEVVMGSGSWMFLDITLKDYLGFRKLSEPSVQKLSDALIARQEQLAKQGIPYRLVIAPDKIKVYPDKKPGLRAPADTIRRIDQLKAALPAEFKPNLMYLRDVLKAARAEKALYYDNDTHWTDYGAYIGYREIVREMQAWQPDMKPVALTAFDPGITNHVGDLVILNGGGKAISAEVLVPKPGSGITSRDYPVDPNQKWHTWGATTKPKLFENPAGRKRLLVFHDSFGMALMKFLPFNFEKTAFFMTPSTPDALADLIEEFHPDYVIEIRVERFLDRLLTASGIN